MELQSARGCAFTCCLLMIAALHDFRFILSLRVCSHPLNNKSMCLAFAQACTAMPMPCHNQSFSNSHQPCIYDSATDSDTGIILLEDTPPVPPPGVKVTATSSSMRGLLVFMSLLYL